MSNPTLSKRQALILFAAPFALAFVSPSAQAGLPSVKAYRNPGCGCCEKWSGLMKDAGFAITMEDDPNLADRKALQSKHQFEAVMKNPKLSKSIVDRASPNTFDYFIWDSELKGFGLKVAKSCRQTGFTNHLRRDSR